MKCVDIVYSLERAKIVLFYLDRQTVKIVNRAKVMWFAK